MVDSHSTKVKRQSCEKKSSLFYAAKNERMRTNRLSKNESAKIRQYNEHNFIVPSAVHEVSASTVSLSHPLSTKLQQLFAKVQVTSSCFCNAPGDSGSFHFPCRCVRLFIIVYVLRHLPHLHNVVL